MKVFMGWAAAGLLLVACEKDKFETKPKLEVKSTSADVVEVGNDLKITLEYFDKEGDVDDSIYVIRKRLNERDESLQNPRTIEFGVPAFPDINRGLIDITMDYSLHLTFGNSEIPLPNNQAEPDTLALQFFIRDVAGNVSDTVSLNKNIIVIR